MLKVRVLPVACTMNPCPGLITQVDGSPVKVPEPVSPNPPSWLFAV
ncbi:hypothetical protein [Flavobacterium suaedae]|nr:hypothetical protein [Flavobacterium suaedae]